MLRLLILSLLLANLAYFAWAQGALAALGLKPLQLSEPARLQQQVQPDLWRVIPAVPAPSEAANAATR